MTFKIAGAWLIAWGIMSLMFSVVGLRLGILWLLDEFGPIIGYLLKFGLIVLGIFLWRRDGLAPVDHDADDEEHRSPVPLLVCGLIVLGVISYIALSSIKDKQAEREVSRLPSPPAWASKPVEDWPALVLLQEARFKTHSPMSAGCACLVRLPSGQLAALTARHLLGKDGGVGPGFVYDRFGMDNTKLASLNGEIVSWKLFLPEDHQHYVNVSGLFGEPAQFKNCDQILLRLTPPDGGCPAYPLKLRLKPLAVSEEVNLVRYEYDEEGNLGQMVCHGRRMASCLFMCELDKPTNLQGCSGAPVLDKDGLLVGIATGALIDRFDLSGQVRNFTARPATELLPALKAALKEKPDATQTAEEDLNYPPARAHQKSGQEQKQPWKPGKGDSVAWN